MEKIDVSEEVESLITKADKAYDSADALRYSQAALNAANAMACLNNIRLTNIGAKN